MDWKIHVSSVHWVSRRDNVYPEEFIDKGAVFYSPRDHVKKIDKLILGGILYLISGRGCSCLNTNIF